MSQNNLKDVTKASTGSEVEISSVKVIRSSPTGSEEVLIIKIANTATSKPLLPTSPEGASSPGIIHSKPDLVTRNFRDNVTFHEAALSTYTDPEHLGYADPDYNPIKEDDPTLDHVQITQKHPKKKPPHVKNIIPHLNFTTYGQGSDEFVIHLGVRKKIQAHSASTPSWTDDYSEDILKFLETQGTLKHIHVIIEISPEEDTYQAKSYRCTKKGKKYGKKEGSAGSEVEVRGMTTQTSQTLHEDRLQKSSSGLKTGFSWTNSLLHLGGKPPPPAPQWISHIHVEMPGLGAQHLPDWKLFLEQQRAVQILILNFGPILWDFYYLIVTSNAGSLTKIVLRRVLSYDPDSGQVVPFDWSMFADCWFLTYLKVTCGVKEAWPVWRLHGNPYPHHQPLLKQERTVANSLIHMKFNAMLPKQNLVEFHFSRFTITQKKLNELALRCPSLTRICVDCADREYYDGDLDQTPGQGDIPRGPLQLLPPYNPNAEWIDTSQWFPQPQGASIQPCRKSLPKETTEPQNDNNTPSRRTDKACLVKMLVIILSVAFFTIVITVCLLALYYHHKL